MASTPSQVPPPARGARTSRTLTVHAFDTEQSSWVRNWASQDWFTVTYFVVMLAALCLGQGPNRPACLVGVAADLGAFLFVLALVRGPVLGPQSAASALLYRTALLGVLLRSFFELRKILPAVAPWSVDARIYELDLRVFGVEPGVAFDRYVTPTATEWFAFFYFLYFILLCVHVIPMVYWPNGANGAENGARARLRSRPDNWTGDTRLLGRFSTGMLLLFLSAHLLYMLVPGYGPYWYLRGSFHHELTGGIFWRLVRETVQAGGAQKDIFPSLHTAVPTFLAIFSFRHRRLLPFKYSWVAVAFFATQIILATMFLRWHYLIDVVAGLTLGTVAALLGQHIADWERAKRERLGLQPVWSPLAFSRGSGD